MPQLQDRYDTIETVFNIHAKYDAEQREWVVISMKIYEPGKEFTDENCILSVIHEIYGPKYSSFTEANMRVLCIYHLFYKQNDEIKRYVRQNSKNHAFDDTIIEYLIKRTMTMSD